MESFDLLYLCKWGLTHQAPFLVKFNGIFPLQNGKTTDRVYVVERINLEIDRLVALATNKPGVKPLLVNGKPLKSVN